MVIRTSIKVGASKGMEVRTIVVMEATLVGIRMGVGRSVIATTKAAEVARQEETATVVATTRDMEMAMEEDRSG